MVTFSGVGASVPKMDGVPASSVVALLVVEPGPLSWYVGDGGNKFQPVLGNRIIGMNDKAHA